MTQQYSRVTQVQFKAALVEGAAVVGGVWSSLPRAGEENAWLSQEAAARYCDSWPVADRADVGGYYVPYVPEPDWLEDGVTSIVTPSSQRIVSYWPEGDLWTVEFGDRGSEYAASELMGALKEVGVEPTNVARARQSYAPSGYGVAEVVLSVHFQNDTSLQYTVSPSGRLELLEDNGVSSKSLAALGELLAGWDRLSLPDSDSD